jgi:hypothetical protein
MDHIIPRAAGGPNALWNLRLACIECNSQRQHADCMFLSAHKGAYTRPPVLQDAYFFLGFGASIVIIAAIGMMLL